MLHRQRYIETPGPNLALWHRVAYPDDSLTREEILTTSADSDVYAGWKRRISRDNGRTWSELEPLDLQVQLPGGGIALYPQGSLYDRRTRTRYQGILRTTWPGRALYSFDWASGNHPCGSHTFVSENGIERLLRFEEGPDFDPQNPFDQEFCQTNQSYAGQSFAQTADGTMLFPVACAERGGKLFTASGIRLMRREPASGLWLSSNPVSISPDWSRVGLQEPAVAVLNDNSFLIVCRGLCTSTMPGYKWVSRSTDGGRTISPVEPFVYDDGTPIYSPDSIHYFFRSSRNGKLYWMANILSEPPKASHPRYPLQIAEIDEEKCAVKRESIVVIDDRREGDPEPLQLSNFSFIEDRETLDLEIYITRLGETPGHFWQAPVYKYIFSPPSP